MRTVKVLCLFTLMLVGLVSLFQQVGVLFGTSCPGPKSNSGVPF